MPPTSPFRFLLLLLSLTLTWLGATAALAQSKQAWQTMAEVDGAILQKRQIDSSNAAYLQVIDVRKMHIDQLFDQDEARKNAKGKYFRGEGKSASPYYHMRSVDAVKRSYLTTQSTPVFALLNGTFFEDYETSSRLSFPIKHNGIVITGGSSPYGPIRKPAHKHFATVQLKALVWDDQRVAIMNYDHKTGAPLSDFRVKNAIVSYAYRDHPAYVFKQKSANRYYLLGALDQHHLVILTMVRGTLDESAQVMRDYGVKGDLLTLDGGSSVYLHNTTIGDIELPQPTDASSNPIFRTLPHFIAIRERQVPRP